MHAPELILVILTIKQIMRVHKPLFSKSAIALLMKVALWPLFIIRNERNGQKRQNIKKESEEEAGGGGLIRTIITPTKSM